MSDSADARPGAQTTVEFLPAAGLRGGAGSAADARETNPRVASLDFGDPEVRYCVAELVYVLHGDLLLRRARGCLAGRHHETAVTPEDLVQGAILVLLAGGIRWKGSIDKLIASLCKTMRNVSRNLHRYESRFVTPAFDETRLPASGSRGADRLGERALARKDVWTVLDRLSPGEREASIACLMYGYRRTELAEESGKAASTVRNQLSAAIPKLREGLAAHAPAGRRRPGGRAAPGGRCSTTCVSEDGGSVGGEPERSE